MNHYDQYSPDYVQRSPVLSIPAERVAFVKRTYAHLAGAILAFAAIDALLLQLFTPRDVFMTLANVPLGWMGVLLAFMAVSWIADRWAQSDMPVGMQYLGLTLYVVLEAVIFLPLLCLAQVKAPGSIETAGILTGSIFGGLTMAVFLTGKDFSALRTGIVFGCWIAFGLIVAAWIFGFVLGTWFALAMVILLCGCILYETSNVLHHYHTNQHVAAALALFASFATLLWYILQLVMRNRN